MGAAAGAAGAAAGETLMGARLWTGQRVALVRVQRSECCGSQAVVAALGVMGEKLDAVAKGNFELRNDADRLHEENDVLRGNGGPVFRFALEVRKDDFWRFAVIMALGNRKAAAKHLKVRASEFLTADRSVEGEQAQGTGQCCS